VRETRDKYQWKLYIRDKFKSLRVTFPLRILQNTMAPAFREPK